MKTFYLLLRRSLAFLYDALLLIALFFVVTALLLTLTDGVAIQHPLFYLALWLLGGVFFTGFWKRGGQTLGMRAWNLRLVSDDEGLDHEGDHIAVSDPRALWLRYVVGTLAFGFGFVFAVFDARGRTLNDRLSQTSIIKDSNYLKTKA